MRFAFIIQGEGRGHQTQAIALLHLLKRNGHEVVLALTGSRDGKTVPTLMQESFDAPVCMFESPALVYSRKTKALSLSGTLLNTIPHLTGYLRSLAFIRRKIQETNPDVIVNFYDVLGGIYHYLFRPDARFYCVAHQYLLLNRHFIHPDGFWLDRLLVNTNTRLTCLRADKKLALSFSAFPDDEEQNIVSVTPLLRPDIKFLRQKTSPGNYLLIYLTQRSIAEDIVSWSLKNPETPIHCFTDRDQNEDVVSLHVNLHFHRINSHKFLQMMAGCRGLITTAGFESVCEAMILDKPVMMIPVKSHYEQRCNASDGVRAGAGIWRQEPDICAFLDYLNENRDHTHAFFQWYIREEEKILEEMNCRTEMVPV